MIVFHFLTSRKVLDALSATLLQLVDKMRGISTV